jgi:hypothetical protein
LSWQAKNIAATATVFLFMGVTSRACEVYQFPGEVEHAEFPKSSSSIHVAHLVSQPELLMVDDES